MLGCACISLSCFLHTTTLQLCVNSQEPINSGVKVCGNGNAAQVRHCCNVFLSETYEKLENRFIRPTEVVAWCIQQSAARKVDAKGKDKGSSLDIAPLTILDSGTLQPRQWQLTGNDCSNVNVKSKLIWPTITKSL